ncbi:MAG: IS1634 family transposase, partial [Anaerovoracaceae bacterium]
MKLNYDRKAKDPTYFVQLGIRNGKKTTTKNIARIGKHSELLKITDDPLAYAKEQVKKYNEEYKKNNNISLDIQINLTEKIKATQEAVSKSTQRNVGYLYLQKLYQQLDIASFFKDISADSKITFNPDIVNQFMTYSRILDPDSKLGSLEKRYLFYEQPEFEYQHIMRTMDLMYNNYNKYIEHLFKNSEKISHRNTSVCYYDCTNYYCEAESPDADYIDEVTGEIFTGLRQYGFAKDHKPNPLVEMGLFMDANGIPISMCIAPGNVNEQTTAIPLESELIKMFNDKKKEFIYCADAGLGSYHIRNFNSMGGRAFVITQSVKKLSDVLQTAVFNDCDYRLVSSNLPVTLAHMKEFDKSDENNMNLYADKAYKVLEANTAIDVGLYDEKVLNNGKTRKVKSKAVLKQHVIITFSRKYMEYQRYIRNRQVERAEKIVDTLDPESYKKGPNDVTRFIRKKGSSKDTYEIDTDKIKMEEKYDGFYAVATNLEGSAKDILAVNDQRYKIEDCFRLMKTDFKSRPYFHRKRERIIAHFMICYTALLIYRLLEEKLKKVDKNLTARNI